MATKAFISPSEPGPPGNVLFVGTIDPKVAALKLGEKLCYFKY